MMIAADCKVKKHQNATQLLAAWGLKDFESKCQSAKKQQCNEFDTHM
jgi:hypothetical protein